ncbi:peptide methionine sulfoxide reductase A2-1-like [Ananas comosus]|uniref:peptide-methionine (S)-S-oxide reductase n=1 Tax=Ananas comosus TaxID=4615 RepID=A0A6P5GT24_ANACO|nr:peptide methionine sulfoxide reductase A2-1-like [Ananas comosus]
MDKLYIWMWLGLFVPFLRVRERNPKREREREREREEFRASMAEGEVGTELEEAQFAAGCFWGVELAFQRVEGVVRTEVGYSQGHLPNPTYGDVCRGDTGHAEVVRVVYDPRVCPYQSLLRVFWARHNPTTLNRQGNDVGTQYRSGIYYYTEEQAKLARESMEAKQQEFKEKIMTEILPAKEFYRAEEYHQQYLEKGGGRGDKQSAEKGCNDPIRCYG